MVMQYLHDAVNGAEGVHFLIKVFCKTGCVAIASECFFVLCEPCAKRIPVCPTYALLQLGQVSLYTPDSENLSGDGVFVGV